VRPINLIPADQRRGPARGPGARTGVGVYVLLGGLGAAVLCVLAFVLTSNSINDKTEELAEIKAEAQGEKQVADALRPYGQFAQVEQAREQQITALASNRFNWERSLRQLSLAIPRNVYLLTVAATESPEVEVEEAGGSGNIATMRKEVQAPAFAITGCTYSQHAVARMMARMRNLDDVTAVRLAKSARRDDTDSSSGPAVTPESAQQDIQDCIGSDRITKFEILVLFGGAGTAGVAPGAGVGSAAAQPAAAAQGAVGQANEASAAAAGGPAE
jgi:Tfp pilus assembly protein PilN